MTDDQIAAGTELDYFDGRTITRVDMAATPTAHVTIPGIKHAPSPGTYLASPALARLIDATPAEQLGARYGARAGIIEDSALAGPDSLVAVVGQPVNAMLSGKPAVAITDFDGTTFAGAAYRTLAVVGGIALLTPVLLLIGVVSELGAVARAERFATLQLIGASPRTVAGIAAVEIGISAVIGAVAGVLGAWLMAPLVAHVVIDGTSFFVHDLRIDLVSALAIVIVTVMAAVATSWVRALRAGIGPVGASRQRREKRPRFWGALPMVIGLSIMVIATIASLQERPLPRGDVLIIGGFLLVLIGVITGGPITTYWASRFLARYSSTASGVVAMNRIRLHPRKTFRSVSGLVIAVFTVSLFAAGVTSVAREAAPVDDAEHLPLTTLVARMVFPPAPDAEEVRGVVRTLSEVPGVESVGVGYVYEGEPDMFFLVADAPSAGLPATSTSPYIGVNNFYLTGAAAKTRAYDVADPSKLHPVALTIATDGTLTALEAARTAAITGPISFYTAPSTRLEQASADVLTIAYKYASLANLAILIAALISIVSLAVSTTASILDRKRAFGLLRLMGMPSAVIRRVIVAEAALPLVTVLGGCIGLGFFVAWMLVASATSGRRTITWPDPSYYVVVGLSILLAAVAVMAVVRIVNRNTGQVATRFE
ncbi:hypothetical protein AR689_15120 [Arthrobacter sp. EpRS71]|nr:hypothetical protein AR689_15120 [Arthrobacter sp. EpRS71]